MFLFEIIARIALSTVQKNRNIDGNTEIKVIVVGESFTIFIREFKRCLY